MEEKKKCSKKTKMSFENLLIQQFNLNSPISITTHTKSMELNCVNISRHF